jgi:ankyrin repeat protein
MALSSVSVAGLFSDESDLFIAIKKGDVDGVKQHIEYMNTPASERITWKDHCDYCTIQEGEYPLGAAISSDHSKSFEIIKLLVRQGADVNVAGKYGLYGRRTPLASAVYEGRRGTTKFLLQNGAKVNALEGAPELFILLSGQDTHYQANRFNIMSLLINAGADLLAGGDSSHPINEIISAISNYPFSYALETAQDIDATMKFVLTDERVVNYITSPDYWLKEKALIVAIRFGLTELVSKLLLTNVDVSKKVGDNKKHSPLEVALLSSNFDIAEMLVKQGKKLNEINPNKAGYNLIHLAAANNHLDIIKFLLAHGADPKLKTEDGKTARSFAMKAGHIEIYEFLSKLGQQAQPQDRSTTAQTISVGEHNKPVIQILSPAFERGFKRAKQQYSKILNIKGRISDESKIIKATINSQAIYLDSTGHFETEVTLAKGDNTFVLFAEDKHGNNTTTDLKLQVDGFQTTSATSGLNWYNKQYALIIGIDEYQSPAIPPLNNAVNDAKKLSEIFTDQGYQVTTLFNSQASKKSIMTELKKIRKQTKETDSFVFYFAGHGQGLSLEADEKVGYILPYDSDLDLSSEDIFEYDESAISLSQVKKYAQAMGAKHVALLLDSCFSGLAMKRSLPKNITRNEAYYNDILSRQSINILTAGDDQPVSDGSGHSPFTLALIEGLENKAIDINDRDGLATFNELAAYVKAKVEKSTNRRQRPQFDNLSQQDGDLIFNLN